MQSVLVHLYIILGTSQLIKEPCEIDMNQSVLSYFATCVMRIGCLSFGTID
jgi:hypothetical protein